MGIIRGGDAEYESSEPSVEEKREQLEKLIQEELGKDPISLSLTGKYYADEAAEIIAGLDLLCDVKVLNLKDNQISDQGFKALMESSVLKNLRELNLDINYISDEGIQLVADSESILVTELQKLSISENNLTDVGGRALVLSRHFSKLEELDLGWNEIGNDPAVALGETTTLTSLKKLVLERGYINAEGIKEFLKGKVAEHLEELNLTSNQLDDLAVELLATSSKFSQLKSLRLSQNLIGDPGLKALGNSTTLSSLEHLFLGRNHFGKEGAQAVHDTKTLVNLKTLFLQEGVEITPGIVNYSRPELLRPDDPELSNEHGGDLKKL